ncbi:MAG TPA: DUF6600 domain-containing protein, partial [Candidatus Binatia bacterium]|nr:DUF6600 domain-containing protein [Candidatus Binatia bacterium]
YGTARYLQSGYEDYEYEMSRSGRWSYMSEFNSYVWTPYYGDSDWMPYSNGRWVYHPFYGHVWTSYDSCGWFTHHYGRWHWSYTGGWYWIPAYRWSPAWVSWFWDNDYYGWCPLSWWNRPVVIVNNYWDRNYNHHRGIPRHARSTIIIRKNQLNAVNALHVALSRTELEQAGRSLIAYRGAAPSERLAVSKVNVVNARGKTVAYKQNGIVSSDRYRISDNSDQTSHGTAAKAALYRYSPPSDAAGKYSPRIIRSREAENSGESRNDRSFRSKSSSGSSTGSRDRSSDSGSSSTGSKAKDTARSNSTTTSSTSSDSSRETKKKKDEAAYMALLRSENSSGYKSHAAGSAGDSGAETAVRSDSDRVTARAYGSRNSGEPRSTATFPPAAANRFARSGTATPAASDLNTNRYASRSYSNSSNRYVFKGNTSSPSDLNQGQRRSGSSVTFSNRNYSSGDSNRSYGQANRVSQTDRSSRTSRSAVSTATRSSGYSRSSGSSSSSSDSNRSAKKKN